MFAFFCGKMQSVVAFVFETLQTSIVIVLTGSLASLCSEA